MSASNKTSPFSPSTSTSNFRFFRPLVWRWVAPVPGACMLLTAIGLLYASGVYIAVIDSPFLTEAIGVALLFCDIGITLFASLLHKAASDRMYRRAPLLIGLVCAAGLVCQAFMPTALQSDNHILLYASAIALGLGTGGTYVVGLAVLQAWVPESIPTIMGVGMLFISLSSLFGIFLLQFAIRYLGGAYNAILVLSFVNGGSAFIFSTLVSCPPRGWHPSWEEPIDRSLQPRSPEGLHDDAKTSHAQCQNVSRTVDESSSLLHVDVENMGSFDAAQTHIGVSNDVNMSLLEVLSTASLYPYILTVVATLGPATGIMMAFPHMMALLFGMNVHTASNWFIWLLMGGVIGRFIGGTAINVLDRFSSDGTNFFASRAVSSAVLFVQTVCLLAMPLAIKTGYVKVFTALATVIYLAFSVGMVASSCLARSLYTAFNASVTFNMTGVPTGMLEAVYSVIIAGTNGKNGVVGALRTHEFDFFIGFSVVLSAAGLLACLSLSPCEKAYRKAGLQSVLSS